MKDRLEDFENWGSETIKNAAIDIAEEQQTPTTPTEPVQPVPRPEQQSTPTEPQAVPQPITSAASAGVSPTPISSVMHFNENADSSNMGDGIKASEAGFMEHVRQYIPGSELISVPFATFTHTLEKFNKDISASELSSISDEIVSHTSTLNGNLKKDAAHKAINQVQGAIPIQSELRSGGSDILDHMMDEITEIGTEKEKDFEIITTIASAAGAFDELKTTTAGDLVNGSTSAIQHVTDTLSHIIEPTQLKKKAAHQAVSQLHELANQVQDAIPFQSDKQRSGGIDIVYHEMDETTEIGNEKVNDFENKFKFAPPADTLDEIRTNGGHSATTGTLSNIIDPTQDSGIFETLIPTLLGGLHHGDSLTDDKKEIIMNNIGDDIHSSLGFNILPKAYLPGLLSTEIGNRLSSTSQSRVIPSSMSKSHQSRSGGDAATQTLHSFIADRVDTDASNVITTSFGYMCIE
eukprot:GHVN01076103.1.p1 GENE.GHVN01076103.1~~GHVN01076103.1.p1  ORF type:complete len:463 (+),score=70.40 GHVN01076103.1:706-2094(+)